jgi:hypothetical protein
MGGDAESNTDSIKVLCRFRPGRVTGSDTVENFKLDEEHSEVVYQSSTIDNKLFKFDKVYGTPQFLHLS